METDDWQNLIEYWTESGHDIRYLGVPPEIAVQLGIKLPPEETMTEEQTEVIPTGAEPLGAKWKRKKKFDAEVCGLKDCKRKSDGYISDVKPTKGNANGQLWFGPACVLCVHKTNPNMKPMTLAELAFQRNGASDLASVLDVEVGDVLKRLEAAGIDEKGQKLAGAPLAPLDQPPGAMVPAVTAGTILAIDAVVIPVTTLGEALEEAKGVLTFLGTWNIVDQATMDMGGEWLGDVKSKWKTIEEQRTALSKPLRAKLKEIQNYFKPALDVLATAEGILKEKISAGAARAHAEQQLALAAASEAHAAGDIQATAAASQAIGAADVALPAGVSTRPKICFEIINKALLPGEFWSPDSTIIKAYVDAGHRNIPGVRIWEEETVVAPRTTA